MPKTIEFREIKAEIRVLGVSCSPFVNKRKTTPVIGVIYRGKMWLDGVIRTVIKNDGFDATEKIIEMIIESPYYKQLRVILLNEVIFADFNMVDIAKLFKNTNLPVIVITDKEIDLSKVRVAIMKKSAWKRRWNTVQRTGEAYPVKVGTIRHPIFIQIAGISRQNAENIVKKTCLNSNIPEALRVANIIAKEFRKIKID
jgi:endonuclease V-like protein UPF0215 family